MSFNEFSFFSSDGAGRSGVYLSIDANIELSEEDGVFDVYGFLTKMRQQRRGLVETLVSYFDPFLSHTSVSHTPWMVNFELNFVFIGPLLSIKWSTLPRNSFQEMIRSLWSNKKVSRFALPLAVGKG